MERRSKSIGYFLGILVFLILGCVTTYAAEENTISEQVILPNMHTIASDNYTVIEEEGIIDSYGNKYDNNIIRFDATNAGYASYDLNGQYQSFSGKIVASDDTGGDVSINLAIFADGKQLYSQTGITRQMEGQDISLDLTNVGKLEIKTSNDGGYSNGFIFIVDGIFEKMKDSTVYPEYSSLNDMFVVDAKEFESDIALMRDTFGALHNGYQKFYTRNDAYVLYNLEQKFITFEGAFVTSERTNSEASMAIQIYLDDQLAFSQENITKQMDKVTFSLDVTGVKVLKIVTHSEESDSWLYLVDDILKPHVHTAGDWVTKQEPTCTQQGVKVQYCTECNEECNKGEIEALGHKPEDQWEVEIESTCSEEGTEVKYCTVCGEVCEKQEIPLKEHEASEEWEVFTEATCYSEGEEVLKCKNCGFGMDYRSTDRLEHEPGEERETLSPTCTSSGTSVVYCKNCGEVLETNPIPETGHQFGQWVTVSGSVWDAPMIKERICSSCGYRETEQSYAWAWLKPFVTIVILAGAAIGILYALMRKEGLEPKKENIKKLFDKKTSEIKEKRKNLENDEDDIFNRHQ